MRERWRSATDTAWNELSPASPERLGEAARGCSGLSLNGRNCVQNTRSATSATPHPHPHRHASHRDRPICGIHHYKYQSLNELTSENQIHSPLTSGRAQLRARAPAPSPIRDCRFGQLAKELGRPRRRARLGSGVRAVSGCVGGLGSACSGHAAVPRPSSDTLFQATVPRARRPRTPARAADHTTHDTELHSCQCHRHETHTQYTFSTHGTAVFYVPHVKLSAVTWLTRRVRLAKAGPQWPRPRDGRKRAQTRLPAPCHRRGRMLRMLPNGIRRRLHGCRVAVCWRGESLSSGEGHIEGHIVTECHQFQLTDL